MHRVAVTPVGLPDDVLAKLTTSFKVLEDDPTFVKLMSRFGENVDVIDGVEYQKLREEQNVAYKGLVDKLMSQ